MVAMEDKYILTFDAGTGAGRCTLIDLSGRVEAKAYEEWEYDTDVDGMMIFNPDTFWKILSRLCRKVLETSGIPLKNLIGVSATSQREGMVYAGEDGREIYAAPSLDLRGESEIERLGLYRPEIQKTSGLTLSGMFGLARLEWFRNHAPKRYAQIDRVMMISDWILYRLSGSIRSEASIAASSQMFDVRNRCWAKGMLKELGLRQDIFPKLAVLGEVIGHVSNAAAKDTGLPAGLPVVCGGGDTQMALLGMGVIRTGEVGVAAGTTTPVMMALDYYPDLRRRREIFVNNHVVSGLYLLESNGGITGLALRWVRDLFFDGDEDSGVGPYGNDTYGRMALEAADVPKGAHGIRAYLGAEIAARSSKESGFCFPTGLTTKYCERGIFFRAAFEANAFCIRANMEKLERASHRKVNYIPLCGGQSKSSFFNQLLADICGIPVRTFQVKEASALGTALASAVGVGEYASVEEAVAHMVHEEKVFEPAPGEKEKYESLYGQWLSGMKGPEG